MFYFGMDKIRQKLDERKENDKITHENEMKEKQPKINH